LKRDDSWSLEQPQVVIAEAAGFFSKYCTVKQQKQKIRTWGMLYVFWEWTGVVRILVIFQYRPTMFSHINGKLSPRPLE